VRHSKIAPADDALGQNSTELAKARMSFLSAMPPIATDPCVISNCRRCHKRGAAHARAQAARAQKSIETVSQTERRNITGGEPAAALAHRT
jgi:hypothetical protein